MKVKRTFCGLLCMVTAALCVMPAASSALRAEDASVDGPYATSVQSMAGVRSRQKEVPVAVSCSAAQHDTDSKVSDVTHDKAVYSSQRSTVSYVPEIGLNTANESRIFDYLKTELCLTDAAVYGILTNIYCESRFEPAATCGDSCLGIVQWTASRYDDFIYWANAKVYDPYSLDTQMLYLYLELTNAYYSVYEKLLACGNDSEGLYNAAYLFCKRFEIPYDTENQSIYRAQLAVEMYADRIG